MPPPRKAAKKVAKKAAKKTAGHHHDKRHQAHDLRRAYEHMGRLKVLRGSLQSTTLEAVGELTNLAQAAIEAGHNRDAADLLRASEHLSFAVLAEPGNADSGVSPELQQSIREHFDELTRRAEEHWDPEQHSTKVSALYQSARKYGSKAFKDGAYHQALEFIRAAEALAHVSHDRSFKLGAGSTTLQLKNA